MNEYGGIELTQVQEDIYKVPDNEIGYLKDAFCVDKSILAVYNTDTRSYIEEEFAPQEYGVATTKGSGLSTVVEDLIQEWLADGTIDGFIAENGLE